MAATVAAASPAVAAPVLRKVSIEEYLRTSYDPDVEYVDGYLKEKPVGDVSAWGATVAAFVLV